MPNITTNHAITYTNRDFTQRFLSDRQQTEVEFCILAQIFGHIVAISVETFLAIEACQHQSTLKR